MPPTKEKLHPRSKHRERYDFEALAKTCPELSRFVSINKYGDSSVDFFDPKAVIMLNKALLQHHYDIKNWAIPAGYLCPPIPGRADYIHYIADLLATSNHGKIPVGNRVKCLDVGVGANCVYPIVGNKEYGWTFVGSDTDPVAVGAASDIVAQNITLKDSVEIRLQPNKIRIFDGIIQENELFDLSICNPPFFASPREAQASTLRKLSNLKHQKISNATRNFGGQNNELWCEGGEAQFVRKMIDQSRQFATSCLWFSSLISQQSNLESIYKALRQAEAVVVKTIPMQQGNKTSRIVAWTFLAETAQKDWAVARW